jgi:hypothetical protein
MGDTSDNTLFTSPEPQANLGLNAAVVYGEAVTAVLGATTSLVLGCNANFTINPLTMIGRFSGLKLPPTFKAFGMGSAGGNLSFTIGTKADLVMGTRYEVNWGGKIELDLGEGEQGLMNTIPKNTNNVFGLIIAGLVIAFFAVYSFIKNQNVRANVLVAMQATLNVLVTVLIGCDVMFKQSSTAVDEATKKMYAIKGPKDLKRYAAGGIVAAATSILPAVILPAVSAATAEAHFDNTHT